MRDPKRLKLELEQVRARHKSYQGGIPKRGSAGPSHRAVTPGRIPPSPSKPANTPKKVVPAAPTKSKYFRSPRKSPTPSSSDEGSDSDEDSVAAGSDAEGGEAGEEDGSGAESSSGDEGDKAPAPASHGKKHGKKHVEKKLARNQELDAVVKKGFDAMSLPEASVVSDKVKTPLLPHQLQGLYWLVQKEQYASCAWLC